MPHSPLESRLLKALMEAETTIRQLEQDNTRVNAQLAEKTLICQQLLNEKQEHVLHMARCSSVELLQQLEKARSQIATLQMQVQQMSDKYELQHKSERQEIKKLVSYNRALRVENNSLREKVARSSAGSRRVGTITTLGNPQQLEITNSNTTPQRYTITPNKIHKRQMSTAFTAQRSEQFKPHSQVSQQLFVDHLSTRLEKSQVLGAKVERVDNWMKRMKHLMQDSDGEETQ